MFSLTTDWGNCPDFIPGESVGLLWTIVDGKGIKYHWNKNTKVLYRVIGSDSQPIGLCLDTDQAMSVSLIHFGGLNGQSDV